MLQPHIVKTLEQASRFIFVPTTEQEYDRLVELLDALTDIVRDDENHPLARMMDVIGTLIEIYEDEHVPEPAANPIEALKHFMAIHQLRQKDLPEIGSQGVVSDILNGRRELNLRQIRALEPAL